jgi:hypothetical protein
MECYEMYEEFLREQSLRKAGKIHRHRIPHGQNVGYDKTHIMSLGVVTSCTHPPVTSPKTQNSDMKGEVDPGNSYGLEYSGQRKSIKA